MPKLARIDSTCPETLNARQPLQMTRVWDPLVRVFHWSLVASFAVAWITPRSAENIHHWAGYVAGALVFMRLLWGILGTPYARFSQFVRHPKSVVRYLLAILSGREARYIGHNPVGGMMVLALMSLMTVISFTGWLMTTDVYFGEDWMQNLHSLSAHGLLLLVLVHVGGVLLASVRHRENLVRAMITGRKRNAGTEDIS